jgi:DNA-directed RNA polymerases I and III subunit RPAC2
MIMKKYVIALYVVVTTNRTFLYFSPKVDFCGYTIPHPAEDRINIRIQTAEGGEGAPPSYIDSQNLKANEGSKIENYSAYDALEKGFNDLMDLCDVVTETFTAARDAHQDKA